MGVEVEVRRLLLVEEGDLWEEEEVGVIERREAGVGKG